MKPIRTAALLVLAVTLGACGLKGGLDKPPPQFGEARRQYDADQKAQADAAAEKARKEKERQTVTIPTAPATTLPVAPPATPQ